MRILALQYDIAWENPPANYARVRTMLQSASPTGGELVVLPEMFSTGFSMNVLQPPPDRQFISELAREFGVSILAGTIAEAAGGKRFNQALLISSDGAEAACFNKLHPFSPAGENQYFTAGTDILVTSFQGLRIAPLICYDLRFPESFRSAVRLGANVMMVIANWPEARIDHWTTLLRARAIENQSYVLGVNRVGRDPHCSYPGRSMAISPSGTILAELGGQEGILIAHFDSATVQKYRAEFPALADMNRCPISAEPKAAPPRRDPAGG
ncbi:MAG TPA: carbon-nitrogen family hydrolase [Tepidisphaeraceae bacterium]|jgi:predicted amidohydrolase|nr:carbon-nitrogen family hydrolase [Tepidisphaeraceae bacterium]